MALRGFEPGRLYKNQFLEESDELLEYRDFCTDQDGIFLFCPDVSDSAAANTGRKEFKAEESYWRFLGDHHHCGDYNTVILDFTGLIHGQAEIESGLAHCYRQLSAKADNLLDEWEREVLAYVHKPINEDGFKSVKFKNVKNGQRKKILLLGDSFTFGWSADPIFSGFADELLAMGYWVFNTGITNSDPPQYEAVARKFIDSLEPEAVILNFYQANDPVFYDRIVAQERPLCYNTNRGFVNSTVNGRYYPDLNEALEAVRSDQYIPLELSLFNRIMAATRLGTRCWDLLKRQEMLPFGSYRIPDVPDVMRTKPYLDRIRQMCDDRDIPLFIVFIPDLSGNTPYNQNFDEKDYIGRDRLYFSPVREDGYVMKSTDGHFNNRGHRQYAEFLDSLIRSVE